MAGWQDSFQPINNPPPPAWESSFQPLNAQPQPTLGGTLADVFKSGGAAAARDIAQVPMWLGDTANATTQGITRLAGEAKEGLANLGIGNHLTMEQAQKLTNPTLPFVGSQEVINAVQPTIKEATGADINYQPQTKAGEYTSSVVGALPYAINPEMGATKAIGMGVGQQAGKDIASQFTNDPRYQQVAGIAGGLGGVMAAEPVVAGAKTLAANDIGSNLSNIIGDNTSGGAPGVPKASPYLPTYAPSEIEKAATQAYANAEKMGGQVPIDNMRQAVSSMMNNKDIGQQTERGQAFAGDNPVTQTIGKLQEAVKGNEPWTTADANEIDDSLRNDITKARRAGDYDSARRLGIIKNTLRDTYKSYTEQNPQQAAGFNEWIRGDKLYSAAKNGQEISDIIENAQRADVPSTAIKNGFKKFVSSDDNRIGLTDDEWQAAQYAAKHGILTQGLKNVGSRFGAHIGGIAGGAGVGALFGGPVGAAVGPFVGDAVGQAVTAPFRAWANARQAGRGQNVIDLISQRPVVQETLNPAYKPQTANIATPNAANNIPVMPLRESTPSEQALDTIAQNKLNAGSPVSADNAPAAPKNALEQFQQMVAAKKQPITEKTAVGEQAVIPGAEKISDKELAERNMQKPLQATVPQNKEIGGIFDTEGQKQTDLLDTLKNQPPAIEKQAPAPIRFKEPNEKGVLPTSFKTFIMQPMIGGIKDFGGEVKEVAPALVAKGNKGISIDDALTYAKERGYMPENATQADFLTRLGESDNGKAIYRAKDENRVAALQQSKAAKQNSDPAKIEQEAAGMGIETNGKSVNELLDEMSARKAHEDSLRDYISRHQALEDESNAAQKEHQNFLASRGDAWEPQPEPETRTLEDLENEYEQEKGAGNLEQGTPAAKTPVSAAESKGTLSEGQATGGGSTGNNQETGNGTVNSLLEFLKDEKGSISPKVYEELLNQIQKHTPALVISGNTAVRNSEPNKQTTQVTVKTEPLSLNTKEPVNTAMRDQLMAAYKNAPTSPITDSFAKPESNNNPSAKNPNSSASGLMQFTDPTWKTMVKRYGAETGITLADKNDPKAQQVMAQLYARDNLNRMQPFLKRNPTKGELYQAHLLGSDGALRLINAANNTPNKQAIMLFPKAVTAANHSLFFDKNRPRTALQLYTLLAHKV